MGIQKIYSSELGEKNLFWGVYLLKMGAIIYFEILFKLEIYLWYFSNY